MSLNFKLSPEQETAFVLALNNPNTRNESYIKLELSTEQKESFVCALKKRNERKDLKILVIEDQDFSRKLLIGSLEKDYTCYEAKNSFEGLDYFARYAPDLIFIDVELPDMGAHGLSRLLKTLDEDAYIVMVTSNNYITDIETAKKNKAEGFIVKPYTKAVIAETLDKLIKSKIGTPDE